DDAAVVTRLRAKGGDAIKGRRLKQSEGLGIRSGQSFDAGGCCDASQVFELRSTDVRRLNDKIGGGDGQHVSASMESARRSGNTRMPQRFARRDLSSARPLRAP